MRTLLEYLEEYPNKGFDKNNREYIWFKNKITEFFEELLKTYIEPGLKPVKLTDTTKQLIYNEFSNIDINEIKNRDLKYYSTYCEFDNYDMIKEYNCFNKIDIKITISNLNEKYDNLANRYNDNNFKYRYIAYTTLNYIKYHNKNKVLLSKHNIHWNLNKLRSFDYALTEAIKKYFK